MFSGPNSQEIVIWRLLWRILRASCVCNDIAKINQSDQKKHFKSRYIHFPDLNNFKIINTCFYHFTKNKDSPIIIIFV